MIDLEAIKSMWLNQCGPCDYGMPEYGCTHPSEDYRLVIVELVREVERLRAVIADNPSWAAYLTVVDDAELRRHAEDLARDLRAARAEVERLRLGTDVVTAEQLSDAERERDEARAEAASAQQSAERAMGVVYGAREAARRLTSTLIASAHLLDVPFTNADGSPWSLKVSPRINNLRVALGMRGAWPKPPPPCCDLHGRHCEPPSELCCWRCTEGSHPGHADGSYCSAPDLTTTAGEPA